MGRIIRATIVAGTFAFALAIGLVVLNDNAGAARSTQANGPGSAPAVSAALSTHLTSQAMPPVLDVDTSIAAPETGMDLPAIRPGAPETPPQTSPPVLAAVRDAPRHPPQAYRAVDRLDIVDPGCVLTQSASIRPGALVALRVDAPCDPSTAGTVHHGGMVFSIVTDANGRAEVSVPVLASDAVIMVTIGGQVATTLASVPEVAGYHRAVLQWRGETGLALHALEDGAGFGRAGHVSAERPGAAGQGSVGSLMSLGDTSAPAALVAEVYSIPSEGAAVREIALTVEAAVTDATCGRSVAVQTILLRAGEVATSSDLTLRVPGCAAVGEYLVLSNMVRDLTLASR